MIIGSSASASAVAVIQSKDARAATFQDVKLYTMDYYLNYSALETTNNYSFSSINTNTPMSKDLFPGFIVLKLRKLPAQLPDMISNNETLIPVFKNLSLLQYFVA